MLPNGGPFSACQEAEFGPAWRGQPHPWEHMIVEDSPESVADPPQ